MIWVCLAGTGPDYPAFVCMPKSQMLNCPTAKVELELGHETGQSYQAHQQIQCNRILKKSQGQGDCSEAQTSDNAVKKSGYKS